MRIFTDHSLYEAWCLRQNRKPRRPWSDRLAELIAWLVVGGRR